MQIAKSRKENRFKGEKRKIRKFLQIKLKYNKFKQKADFE